MRSREAFPGFLLTLLLMLTLAVTATALLGFAGEGAPEKPRLAFQEARDRLWSEHPDGADDADEDVRAELAIYRAGQFPDFRLRWTRLLVFLKEAARRAVREPGDFDARIVKLLHPMGICFSGVWRIDQANPYTGAFAPGARALFLGRASTADGEWRAGRKRPFGFAGKLFPTMDPQEQVATANFVTIDNLGGTRARHFLDVALTNEPAAGFAFTPGVSLSIFFAFNAADRDIFMRPVRALAKSGPPEGWPIRAPKWMRLRPRADMPRVDETDFREELDLRHYPQGLIFDIHASDRTQDPLRKSGWSRLGELVLTESVVSYACDRQLRFQHDAVK
ncbi:MAG: hypothetical protein IT285_04185 [Bdellovibrionales bacterium]|nr:hypothetical protein [Bdellovibrionales bacterium]